jgi:hypothetical protein
VLKGIWYGLIKSLEVIIIALIKGLNPVYETPHDQRTTEIIYLSKIKRSPLGLLLIPRKGKSDPGWLFP